ncbi:MAG: hypothetical protein IPM54_27110 [Polyangiaceae bacterium]|nr:hypothetical protein [Polyangiaceae bacterium]
MDSFNKLLIGTSIAMLGGCILAYDYDKHDGQGTGGSGGENAGGTGGGTAATGGNGGEPAGSSSSSGMGGAGGTGGIGECNVSICNDPALANCNAGTCMQLAWAKRFGSLEKRQEVNTVALDKNENIIIAGAYSQDAFSLDAVPLPPGASYQSFLARMHAGGGVEWAQQGPSGEYLAVAADSKGDIIAAGFLKSGETEYSYIEKRSPSNPTATIWNISSSNANQYARITAIDVDASDNIYAVGTTTSGFNIECPAGSGTMVNIVTGMFIIKYNGNGACQWAQTYSTGAGNVKPVAMRLDNASNLWITGQFQNILSNSVVNKDAGAGADMFLAPHNTETGAPLNLYVYGQSGGGSGSIEPAAIEVDETGNVVVVGQVNGQTVFEPGLASGQPAAFVARIRPADGAPNAIVLPGGAQVFEGTRASGVALGAGKLFVSGTFATTMAVDPARPDIVGPVAPGGGASNTAFLAVLDPVVFKLLSFEYFAGHGESFTSRHVHVAVAQSSTILAGGWTKSLDFSNGQGGQNFLMQDPSSTEADIFVARFIAGIP